MNEQEEQQLEQLQRRMRAVTNKLAAKRYGPVLRRLPILGSMKRIEVNAVAIRRGIIPFEAGVHLIERQIQASEKLLERIENQMR